MGRIPKWSWAFNGVVGTAALLLPLSAAPESHVPAQTTKTATDSASSAAAHVDFKIIIPRVLSLSVADATAAATGPVATVRFNTVAVASNSHNVALTATIRSPAESAAGNVILSAAARKTIAQDAVCAGPARSAGGMGAPVGRIICTASMP